MTDVYRVRLMPVPAVSDGGDEGLYLLDFIGAQRAGDGRYHFADAIMNSPELALAIRGKMPSTNPPGCKYGGCYFILKSADVSIFHEIFKSHSYVRSHHVFVSKDFLVNFLSVIESLKGNAYGNIRERRNKRVFLRSAST
tara:strand:- start:709 stop:1128 length:420 start_codon:yes stop_codon:yes gene_type:complete